MPDSATTDWFPLSRDEHERQVAAVLRTLGPPPARVLDLCCGDGRVARPLGLTGHRVTGVDSDPAAVERCLGPGVGTRRADVRRAEAYDRAGGAPYDAVLCLGNSFMLFTEHADAAAVLRLARGAVHDQGVLLLDALCTEMWREVASGRWAAGVSDDGAWQMVWAEDDAVIAVRQGSAVDPGGTHFKPDDRPMRLWTIGELRFLASLTGWQPPAEDVESGLMVWRPASLSPVSGSA